MPLQGNPLEPCPQDSLNGYHDWIAVGSDAPAGATGNPAPGARTCLQCGAIDTGPLGIIKTHKDSLLPVFPAGTRSYRVVNTHNPDDPSPMSVAGEPTN